MSSLFLGVLMKFSPMQRQTCTHMTLTHIVSIFCKYLSFKIPQGAQMVRRRRRRRDKGQAETSLSFTVHPHMPCSLLFTSLCVCVWGMGECFFFLKEHLCVLDCCFLCLHAHCINGHLNHVGHVDNVLR